MRLNVLCEGQTEEAFVNRVLRPHLAALDVYVSAQCIPKKKNTNSRSSKGGWISYTETRKALLTWMKSDRSAWFTTMLDLYAIPTDYPQLDKARDLADPRQRVTFLEEVLQKEVESAGFRQFIAYLQLHEFEALIFAAPAQLDHEYLEHDPQIANLIAIADREGDPELINDRPETAPSKRILKEIPEYAKVKSGALVAEKIGLPTLRDRCKHFGEWLHRLERLPQSRDSSSP
jgi:hypothetical protein